MKDHHIWRAHWHYSELHDLEEYDRRERRHAWAAFLGALTSLLCAAVLYLVS